MCAQTCALDSQVIIGAAKVTWGRLFGSPLLLMPNTGIVSNRVESDQMFIPADV